MAEPDDTLALADWRRRVFGLYAAVRCAAGAEIAWRAWRRGRDALLARHRQTPLEPDDRRRFRGLPYYPYDAGWRFAVALRPLRRAPVRAPKAGQDGTIRLRPFARTDGLAAALGGELTLYWIEGYGGGLFLPFRDATAGRETFGGGRYLLDGIKGADLGTRRGRLVVDFNFAYHPSCAYSARWVCPLAPPENRVPRAVTAGERL
jgi:hypothetical protein